jgi:hypothetical protein
MLDRELDALELPSAAPSGRLTVRTAFLRQQRRQRVAAAGRTDDYRVVFIPDGLSGNSTLAHRAVR